MTGDGMVRCPDCRGRGTVSAFVDYTDRSKSGFYPSLTCSRCKGLGAIDRQQEEWMRIGGVHRTWRVAQHEGQRDCAQRLGISVVDLSAMEQGKADPTRLIADTPEVLRDAP